MIRQRPCDGAESKSLQIRYEARSVAPAAQSQRLQMRTYTRAATIAQDVMSVRPWSFC